MRTHFRKRRFRGSSPLERLMILVVIAALLGVVIGLALPKISPSIGEITGEYIASGPAADALNGLQVDDRPDSTGYDRDSFGFRATDDDGDGCERDGSYCDHGDDGDGLALFHIVFLHGWLHGGSSLLVWLSFQTKRCEYTKNTSEKRFTAGNNADYFAVKGICL